MHVADGGLDVVRLHDADAGAAPVELRAEVGQPAVEGERTGAALPGGRLGVRERRAPGRLVVVLEVGEEHLADDPLVLELGGAALRIHDARDAAREHRLLVGVALDHVFAEERVDELGVLGETHRPIALGAPGFPLIEEAREFVAHVGIDIGPVGGDGRPSMAIGRDQDEVLAHCATPGVPAERSTPRQ